MHARICNPQSTIRNAAQRSAYTLMELLVVMVILAVLVAAALPLVKRVMDNDRVREASRQLTAYINMAKTRAVQTGRPCGLLFVLEAPLGASTAPTNAGPYTPANPARYVRQCTKVFLAEVPPTYSGSTQGARGRIRLSLTVAGAYEFYPIYYNSGAAMPGYEPDPSELNYLYALIKDTEQFLVQFEHKGPWYVCQRSGSQLLYTGNTVLGSPTPLPPGYMDTATSPSSNPGYFYQIMRSPEPVGNPLELTGATCVDMTYSGMGMSGNEFILASTSVAVMFTPSGGITGVYGDGSAPQAPLGTLHFLIGRLKKMNQPDGASQATPPHPSGVTMFSPTESNVADATSLWVSVGRTTGTVSTAENVPNTAWTDFTLPGGANFLADARQIATGREQMGGQ